MGRLNEKKRVVILGGNSFVASNLINLLIKNNNDYIAISKKLI